MLYGAIPTKIVRFSHKIFFVKILFLSNVRPLFHKKKCFLTLKSLIIAILVHICLLKKNRNNFYGKKICAKSALFFISIVPETISELRMRFP
jgi:hypothetical protein